MKRFSLMICVVMALFIAVSGNAQRDKDRRHHDRRDEMNEDKEARELDIQERRAELQFQQQMRKLKLERTRRQMMSENRHPRLGSDKTYGKRLNNACHMMKKRIPRFLLQLLFPLILIAAIVHILLAVWVYKDIRERNSNSGIWIAITLLTGMCGAAVYAIVRLGDGKK